jgi:RNA polymerase sigma-70 factor (ECF subfamily)
MSEVNQDILLPDASPYSPPTVCSPTDATDDVTLMRLAREDTSYFAPLYQRYFDPIYAYCRKRVGTPEEAEDLTSLTFMQALHDVGPYRGGSVAAWLFRIAHNRVADHYRRRRAQVPFSTVEFCLEAADSIPLDALIQTDDYQVIRGLVAALPDCHREILALKINSGLTADEIGAIVGMKAGAVRVLLHRIIKRLRARYEATQKQEGIS